MAKGLFMLLTLALPLPVSLLAQAPEAAAPQPHRSTTPVAAGNSIMAAAVVEVYAWVNAMPGSAPGRYVIVTVELRNKSANDMEFILQNAFLAVDGKRPAKSVHPGLSWRGSDGRPSGEMSVVVPAGRTISAEFRGDDLYDARAKTLQVTLFFSAGAHKFILGGQSRVEKVF